MSQSDSLSFLNKLGQHIAKINPPLCDHSKICTHYWIRSKECNSCRDNKSLESHFESKNKVSIPK